MPDFVYDALPGRIVFGVGSVDRIAAAVHIAAIDRTLMPVDAS